MSRIFISYARTDVDFARKLARSLSEMGADIWIDVENIPAGMKWSTAIQQGLNVCQVMLVIISPDSMASNNVEDEWQYYLDKKKPVIPIWYRPADKHFQISRLQHIDFHAASYHLAFDRLLHELLRQGVPIQLPTTDSVGTAFLPPAAPPKSQPEPVGAQGFAPSVPNSTPSPRIEFPSTRPARTQPTPTEPAPGTRMTDDKGVEMVYVPAGKFLMGSNEKGNEKPIHEVQIAQPFWLDLTPVTNAAYEDFIKAEGYITRDLWTEDGWTWIRRYRKSGPKNYNNFFAPHQPRVGVTWFEANAYATWRGCRLPTESEWEWAARGPENRLYPWGNNFNEKNVIFEANSGGKTASVGLGVRTLGQSWVGALDMCGNVWEWVNSPYKPYLSDETSDESKTPDFDVMSPDEIMAWMETLAQMHNQTIHRVIRGGSWAYSKKDLLLSRRFSLDPNFEVNAGGFRCARTYQPGDI